MVQLLKRGVLLMLISLIIKPFAIFINFLIGLLGGFFGDFSFIVSGLDALINLIGYGVYFMGFSTFQLCISSISFWFTVDIIWACIEWVYKKIPGVD